MCVRERKDVFYERQTEYVRMRIKAECVHKRKTKSFCLCWKKELLHNWKEREYEKMHTWIIPLYTTHSAVYK